MKVRFLSWVGTFMFLLTNVPTHDKRVNLVCVCGLMSYLPTFSFLFIDTYYYVVG